MKDREFRREGEEFTPPLPEIASPGDEFLSPPQKAEEARERDPGKRRRRLQSRPLIQVAAAAMAIAVTGAVAKTEPEILPKPVAQIVEELAATPVPATQAPAAVTQAPTAAPRPTPTAAPTPTPTEAPPETPQEVLDWLEELTALFAADAEDETIAAALRSQQGLKAAAWTGEQPTETFTYANGQIGDAADRSHYPVLVVNGYCTDEEHYENEANWLTAPGDRRSVQVNNWRDGDMSLSVSSLYSFRGTVDGDTAEGVGFEETRQIADEEDFTYDVKFVHHLEGSFLKGTSREGYPVWYLENGTYSFGEFEQWSGIDYDYTIDFQGILRDGVLSGAPGYEVRHLMPGDHDYTVDADYLEQREDLVFYRTDAQGEWERIIATEYSVGSEYHHWLTVCKALGDDAE